MKDESGNIYPEQHKVSRRSFVDSLLLGAGVLSIGGIAGSVGSVLAADKASPAGSEGPPTGQATTNHAGHMPMAEDMSAGAVKHSAEDMDRMHREGLEAFMRNQTTPITAGKGNVPLTPEIDNGVKVFKLSVDELQWETCLLYTSPSPRDGLLSRMPSSA